MRASPDAGSSEELVAWRRLQAELPELYRRLTADAAAPQTVVVIPSLSLDPRELGKIAAVGHYEERMLVNLMLLRQPRTKLVFVSSGRIDPAIVEYYLGLLPGVPVRHARRRLVMLHCDDASPRPLTQKILERPELLRRIRSEVDDPAAAHVACFVTSPWERTLGVRLGLPVHGVDPELTELGSKSGCREIFREAGVPCPDGFERLASEDDIVAALVALKVRAPGLARAVVKLDHGFSGEGNAVFPFVPEDAGAAEADLSDAVRRRLRTTLRFEAPSETYDAFLAQFTEMRGVVEAWVDGVAASPSVQCRVNAVGLPQVISTHDQVLGGRSGQTFLGCRFPASPDYRLALQGEAALVASVLAERGVIGRFGIDFVSVPTAAGWTHHAIEINLRKGGTTHPFLTLKFLTDGVFDPGDGCFYSPSGRVKHYVASDGLGGEAWRGLRPDDVVDVAVREGLHWHAPQERGVVFHLLGALPDHGRLGMVAIADAAEEAEQLYHRMITALDAEVGVLPSPPGPSAR